MISLQTLVMAIFGLIIAGLIFWLLWWAVNAVGVPQPFLKIAQVLLVLGAVFICIAILLSLLGHPIVAW